MVSTAPNFKKNSLYDTPGLGKSRSAYYEGGAGANRVRLLKFADVAANFQFTLPANVRLSGDIVIFNNSANTQAAITVGTAAAGTQIDSGATTATLTTAIRAATDTGVTRADRTVYVASTAWQTGVHIVFSIREYPPVKDITAIS